MIFDDQIWSGFLSFFSILKIVQAIWSLHMLLAFILLCFKPCCKWLQKMEFVPLPPQSFSRDMENFGDTCVFMTSCKRKLCETCLVFASTSNFFGCKSANMGKFWWKNMGHWSVDIYVDVHTKKTWVWGGGAWERRWCKVQTWVRQVWECESLKLWWVTPSRHNQIGGL